MLTPLFDFDWFGLPIYFILLAIGIWAGFRVLKKQQNGKVYGKIFLLITIILSFVVANVTSWFLYPDMRFVPLGMRFSIGTMFFYTGMLSFFGLSILFRLKNDEWKQWIHEAVPAFIMFSFFERIGAILAGHGYGIPFSVDGIPLTLFPSREIEAFSLLVMYFVFKKIKQHRFMSYLLSYSVLRFALEFGRGDDRGRLFINALSPTQMVSIFVWVSLVVWLILKTIRKWETTQLFAQREYYVSKYKTLKSFVRAIGVLIVVPTLIFIWINPFNSHFITSGSQSANRFFRVFTNERSPSQELAVHRYFAEASRILSQNWNDGFFGTLIFTIDEPFMIIDGKKLGIDTTSMIMPIIENNILFIPVQGLLGTIFFEYQWEGNTLIIQDYQTVKISINSQETLVDEETISLNHAPKFVNDRLFLSVCSLEILFCLEYEWDYMMQQIFITRPHQVRRLIVEASPHIDLHSFGAIEVVTGLDNIALLQFATIPDINAAYEQLQDMPGVYSVFSSRFLPAYEMLGNTENIGGTATTPRDNLWSVQSTGNANFAQYILRTGRNRRIVVAIIDSGISYTHPHFNGRLTQGWCAFNHWENINRHTVQFLQTDDWHGHGTEVAGIVVDNTPNLNVMVMPIRVLNSNNQGDWVRRASGATDCSVFLGIQRVVNVLHDEVDVINLSIQNHSPNGHAGGINDLFQTAMNRRNIAVVTIAGNFNRNAGGMLQRNNFLPGNSFASIPNTLTVSAVDSNGRPSVWCCHQAANWGNLVDISAPGSDVNTSVPFFRNSTGFRTDYGGTSAAAPHAAAAIAMYMMAEPNKTIREIKADIVAFVRVPDDWVTVRGDRNAINERWFGTGILDMNEALRQRPSAEGFVDARPNNTQFGRVHATPSFASYGVNVTVSAHPNSGYRFVRWTSPTPGVVFVNPSSITTTFSMPLGDVIVTGHFEQTNVELPNIWIEPSPYSVYVDRVRVDMRGYSIHWQTYFRLRDVARVLFGTSANFSVGWIDAQVLNGPAIILQKGQNHDSSNDPAFSPAIGRYVPEVITPHRILLGETPIHPNNLRGYYIRPLDSYYGENFFMIRDLGNILGFCVVYIPQTSIRIYTVRCPDGCSNCSPSVDDDPAGGDVHDPEPSPEPIIEPTPEPIPQPNLSPVSTGRFIRADGETGIMAGFPWVEFRGNQFEIPIAGGIGGVSVASSYTFNNGNLTFQLDGVNVTWRLEIINDNSIRLDFGVGIFIDFVRDGSAQTSNDNIVSIPRGRFVRADGMTGVAAGYPWLEFSETQITIPLMGGIGGVSVTSNFTQRNGNITFQLDGANVTWQVIVINNNEITVDFGIGIGIDFIRE